ncbi:MAG TPA: hypothetical protein VK088_11310 [Acidimicrobiia bacterium]|nr:hypothetical protein [Acidimicrobiia bacterium]
MDFTELMIRFGAALGAGLLVGLQRSMPSCRKPTTFSPEPALSP